MSIRLTPLGVIVASFCAVQSASAASVLIGGFNFNNLSYAGVAGTTATLAVVPKNTNSPPAFVTGTTLNAVGTLPTDYAENALQFTGSNNNLSTLTFSFNAKGFNNIGITFASMITGTFFSNDQISISSNGTSFTNFGSAFSPATGSFQIVDRGPIVALSDVQTAFIRLTIDGPTTGSGNFLIDNVQITGTPIAQGAPTAVPLPPAAVAGVVALGAGALRRCRHR